MNRNTKSITLSQDQIERINAAARELHDLLPDIQAAQACGVECQEIVDTVAFLQEKLTAYKKHFAPQPVV